MPNLLSLLNIVDDNERFGNLRLLWELGGMGERSVQKVREHVCDLRSGFAKRSLEKQRVASMYSDLVEDLITNLTDTGACSVDGNTELTESNHTLLQTIKESLLLRNNVVDTCSSLGDHLRHDLMDKIESPTNAVLPSDISRNKNILSEDIFKDRDGYRIYTFNCTKRILSIDKNVRHFWVWMFRSLG